MVQDGTRCIGTWATLPSLSQDWRFRLDERFNSEFTAALLGFNGEAVVYCKGISDIVAQEYAMEYTRMLQNRAKGVEARLPRIPAGLFEPNRNLIRSTLERMWEKYFLVWMFIFIEILQPVGFGLRPRLHSCQVGILMP